MHQRCSRTRILVTRIALMNRPLHHAYEGRKASFCGSTLEGIQITKVPIHRSRVDAKITGQTPHTNPLHPLGIQHRQEPREKRLAKVAVMKSAALLTLGKFLRVGLGGWGGLRFHGLGLHAREAYVIRHSVNTVDI